MYCVGVKILTATTSHTVLDMLPRTLGGANSDSPFQSNCTGYLVMYSVGVKFWQPFTSQTVLNIFFVDVKSLTATTSHTLAYILSCVLWVSNTDSHDQSHCTGYLVMYFVGEKILTATYRPRFSGYLFLYFVNAKLLHSVHVSWNNRLLCINYKWHRKCRPRDSMLRCAFSTCAWHQLVLTVSSHFFASPDASGSTQISVSPYVPVIPSKCHRNFVSL